MIDAGSGAHRLGQSLLEEPGGRSAHIPILLTHYHWDHIQGLPYFAPVFQKDRRITFWSGKSAASARSALDLQLSEPYFPGWDSAAADREFNEVSKQPFHVGSIAIYPFPLNHPQGAWGYRMESDGGTIVHASDFEHGHPQLDSVLREYARNADVLIYDAQYTSEEYESKKGWGHSTWMEATRVAHAAGVKQLILFHHDPMRDDLALRSIVEEARRQFQNTHAATEGSVVIA
ncbi:MAG: hypothetical protein HYX27_19230 [Acidobacteria bacterium]|nr:hypothetical protein [Acidobacteriota bacterium]